MSDRSLYTASRVISVGIHPNSGPTSSEKDNLYTDKINIGNIKIIPLLCFLLYQGMYALQGLHTASLVCQG